MEVEFAGKFNAMPKYVVTSTLDDLAWSNSTVLRGDLVEEVSNLRRRINGEIGVHGSARLADELRLMVFPVVLGNGKRLFSDVIEKRDPLPS